MRTIITIPDNTMSKVKVLSEARQASITQTIVQLLYIGLMAVEISQDDSKSLQVEEDGKVKDLVIIL